MSCLKKLGAALFLCLLSTSTMAQVMDTTTPLSFGNFGLRDNNGVYSITVTTGNSTTYSPEIVSRVDATRGEYTFTGLPANVTFFAGTNVPNPPADGGMILDNTTTLSAGGGPVFNLVSLTSSNLVTDNNGDGTLLVGATLQTSGSNIRYPSGVYTGTFDLTLYY